MRDAMKTGEEALGKLIVAHCEDESFPKGKLRERMEAAGAGHPSSIRETGCGYHVCHVSTQRVHRAGPEGAS